MVDCRPHDVRFYYDWHVDFNQFMTKRPEKSWIHDVWVWVCDNRPIIWTIPNGSDISEWKVTLPRQWDNICEYQVTYSWRLRLHFNRSPETVILALFESRTVPRVLPVARTDHVSVRRDPSIDWAVPETPCDRDLRNSWCQLADNLQSLKLTAGCGGYRGDRDCN